MYSIFMQDRESWTTGSLVWHLSLRWRAGIDRALTPLGLTHAQYSVLAPLHTLVRAGDRPSQRELAEQTGLQPIYISKLVRALERGGFVSSERDPRDARAVRLDLTEQGHRIALRAKDIVQRLDHENTRALRGKGDHELVELHRALSALLDATDAADE
jgi:DNA-binding MarR family transcriptional regulator